MKRSTMPPLLLLLPAMLLPSAAALAANPAIDTSVPCNSNQIAFMPMRTDAVEYVRKLPGAGPVVSQGDGTYLADFGNPDAVNALLEYDTHIRILGEMKPNEPMDQAYLPTPGHFLALCYKTADPARTGVLIESAHSILAGLDPSDDMAYALWHQKLWSVHLNDQNGLKYDQDKVFGSVDLRRAFNTVWVLERAGYDGCVGLDVKAMRTTKPADQTRHLVNSRALFLRLLEVVRSVDPSRVEEYRAERNYEGLEMYILEKLMGK